MEYYAAETKKELLHFVTACMDLENILLSEVSQCERQTPYNLTYKRNLMKNKLTNKIEPQAWKHGTD